jgi:uncharacterized membrane protein YgdD (TMEM256/DUF423 family)
MARYWVSLGALLAGAGVAAGAFGAHGLKDVLSSEHLATYETAVRYQMYHAFAIIITGLLVGRSCSKINAVAGWLFLLGIVLFSGCLYAWIFTQIKPLVMIVPLGGLSWIIAWLALAWSAMSSRPVAE